jgi:hypothetical protein
MSTGTNEIATSDSAGKDVTTPKHHDTAMKFRDYMGQRAETEGAQVSYDIAARNVHNLMDVAGKADATEEDIWNADTMEMVSGQDLIDVEQKIVKYTVHPAGSEYDNPWGIYIVVTAYRLEDGEELTWNTGAIGIISKLRAFEARGMLPIDGVIRGIKASSGTVLKLAPVPKRAVQVKA